MKGDRMMLRLALTAVLVTPASAQETMPLSDLMSATHVHGIGPGTTGPDSLTLATHNGRSGQRDSGAAWGLAG